MSEIPLEDPMAFTDEQPQQESPEAARVETMGDGIMETTPDDDSSESTGQPAGDQSQPVAAETETPSTPDETEDEKAGRLRYDKFTQGQQANAEERRQLAEERAEFQKQQQSLMEQQRQLLQPTAQQPQAASLYDQLAAAAQDPNLSANDRAGLQVVAQIAQQNQELQAQVQELVQFRGVVEPQFQQHESVIQSISQKQGLEVVESVKSQRADAVTKLGAEAVDAAGPLIAQTFFRGGAVAAENWSPPMKPGTQDAFTIAEYVSLVSGMNAQASQQAKAQNGQARATAQRTASKVGSDTSTDDNTPMTREEVLAAGW